ncbi:MAG: hypothetical protein JOZ39_06695, partial [Chloroflexi bacterium]|nr:hypothetical protein [Chloroflexota bacterium]
MGKVSAVFCTSHSSALLLPFERCQSVYRQVVERRGGRLAEPIQSASDAESWEDARHAHQAILAAVDQLRQRFAVANPDLVIMFGDDQLENLQLSAMPPFFSFIGATSFGHPLKLFQDFFGESPGYRREVAGSEYAPGLISGLVERGFDIAHSDRLPSAEWGLSHSIINVLHLLDIEKPVIPFLVNAFYEPAATPRRCFDLGLGIKEVIEETTPENCRVAVIGSGGLS